MIKELLPDPTPEDIAREAEQEAAVFAQAANIDKLLTMLRGLDPDRDNLADNEEIQVSVDVRVLMEVLTVSRNYTVRAWRCVRR